MQLWVYKSVSIILELLLYEKEGGENNNQEWNLPKLWGETV